MGGLTFDGRHKEDSYSAGGILTFDQFKQDQIVGVQYSDENGKRMAGLRVWDRPEASIKPLLEILEQIQNTPEASEKEVLRSRFKTEAAAMGGAPERVFVGKGRDGTPQLKLSDSEGRPRVLLTVEEDQGPRLRFLDEKGEVVAEYPK